MGIDGAVADATSASTLPASASSSSLSNATYSTAYPLSSLSTGAIDGEGVFEAPSSLRFTVAHGLGLQAFFGGSLADAITFDAEYDTSSSAYALTTGGSGVGSALELLAGTHTPTPHHHVTTGADICSPMPWPWLIYAVLNVCFNISMLLVVKYGGGVPTITPTGIKTTTSGGGAVANFMVGLVATALQYYAFAMPIFPSFAAKLQQPLLWTAHVGFVAVVVGLTTYQFVSYHWRKVGKMFEPDKPPCMSLFPIGYYRIVPLF